MENLMSNTAFGAYLNTKNIPDYEYRYLRNKFDEFLQQKLSIHQFIPCKLGEGFWFVLKEPHETGMDYLKEEYQQAKSNCLFEGFEIEKHLENEFSIRCENNILNVMWNFSDDRGWFPARGVYTLEDLVKYKPKLTAKAKQEIGL